MDHYVDDGEFMDELKQSVIDAIIENFISAFPRRNLRIAAEVLNIKKQRMHDYVVHRYNPPEKLLAKMQIFIQKGAMGLKQAKQAQSASDLPELSILDRADMAQQFKTQFKTPPGRKKIKNGIKKEEMCKNFCTLNEKKSKNERFDVIVAKKFGFKNATTLRQILKIREKACLELKEATNQKRIRIDEAYELLDLSDTDLVLLLQKENKKIKAYVTAKKNARQAKNSGKANVKSALKIAKKHPGLIELEKKGYCVQAIFKEILDKACCSWG